MQDYPILSLPARQALEAFAEKYARVEGGWKEHLCQLWATGGDTQEEAGSLLRLIRNRYGPTWLIETYSALWRPDLPTYEVARWTADNAQLLPTLNPEAVRWSGRAIPGAQDPAAFVQPPALGESVDVRVNKIGQAVVTGYFVEEGWLGLIVRDPAGTLYHVFGLDLDLAPPPVAEGQWFVGGAPLALGDRVLLHSRPDANGISTTYPGKVGILTADRVTVKTDTGRLRGTSSVHRITRA